LSALYSAKSDYFRHAVALVQINGDEYTVYHGINCNVGVVLYCCSTFPACWWQLLIKYCFLSHLRSLVVGLWCSGDRHINKQYIQVICFCVEWQVYCLHHNIMICTFSKLIHSVVQCHMVLSLVLNNVLNIKNLSVYNTVLHCDIPWCIFARACS